MPNGHLQHTRGGYGFAYAARNAEDTVKCDLVAVEARNIEVGQYRVVVEKVGIVFDSDSVSQAKRQFDQFVIESKSSRSGASEKSIALFKDDEVIREYHPPS
jgi:hypothetical protein